MNQLLSVYLDETKDTLTIDKHQLEDGQLYRKNIALLIPMKKDVPYRKHAMEAFINSSWKMATGISPNKSGVTYEEAQQGKTEDDIHEDVIAALHYTMNGLQRMVHSASWRNGTLEEFDKHEIAKHFENAAFMLTR